MPRFSLRGLRAQTSVAAPLVCRIHIHMYIIWILCIYIYIYRERESCLHIHIIHMYTYAYMYILGIHQRGVRSEGAAVDGGSII